MFSLFNLFFSSCIICLYSLFNVFNLLIDKPLLFNSFDISFTFWLCSQFNLSNSDSYSLIDFFYYLIL